MTEIRKVNGYRAMILKDTRSGVEIGINSSGWETTKVVVDDVGLLLLWDALNEYLNEKRLNEEPCGECHLQPGETCDICGRKQKLGEQSER